MSHRFAQRMLRPFSSWPLALAAILSLPLHAAPAAEPLSLAAAQHAALTRSKQLAAQDAAVTSAREMAIAAGQLPDPTLSVGVENLPVSGAGRFRIADDFMTMRRIGVSQELTGSDKRRLRAQRYDREAEKGAAERTLVQIAIARDTALAWFDRYYAERTVDLLAELQQLAQQEIQAADSAYRGGRAGQADVLAANSALALLEDRASATKRRAAASDAMLSRWTGLPRLQMLGSPPATDRIPLELATLDAALAHHPEIAVLRRREDIAETDASLARANRRSDWSVELAYQQRGAGFSNMVSFGLSVPLQWDRAKRQDRELAARLASVDQAKAELEEQLRALIAETRVLIQDWANGRERLARYEHTLLPLAAERSAAAMAAYRGGKTTLGELLQVRRSEVELRVQQLDLQLETDRLWARISYLIPGQSTAMLQNGTAP